MKCATSLKAQFFLGTFLAEGFLLPPLTPELLDGLGSVLNPGLSSCFGKVLWHTVWRYSLRLVFLPFLVPWLGRACRALRSCRYVCRWCIWLQCHLLVQLQASA